MTGSVPEYDKGTGDKALPNIETEYRPFALADKQIICDTLTEVVGHFDPRAAVKLSTTDDHITKM